MRRFQFRLESILRLRENEMDEARAELGRISSLCNKNQMEQETLAAEKRRAFGMVNLPADETGAAQDEPAGILVAYGQRERYLARIAVAAEELFKERAGLELRREQAAEVYREKRIAFEGIRLLKEKDFAAYKKELEGEDQKANDDVAASRFRLLEVQGRE